MSEFGYKADSPAGQSGVRSRGQTRRRLLVSSVPVCRKDSSESLQAWISGKSLEILSIFQRAFGNWECRSSNPPRSARHSRGRRCHPLKEEKSPPLAGFCNSAQVSERPNRRTRGPFRQKSPATTANVTVLQRLSAETGFDHDCRPHGPVVFGTFSAIWRGNCESCRGSSIFWGIIQINRRDRATHNEMVELVACQS
jgi:hypothetical protein